MCAMDLHASTGGGYIQRGFAGKMPVSRWRSKLLGLISSMLLSMHRARSLGDDNNARDGDGDGVDVGHPLTA